MPLSQKKEDQIVGSCKFLISRIYDSFQKDARNRVESGVTEIPVFSEEVGVLVNAKEYAEHPVWDLIENDIFYSDVGFSERVSFEIFSRNNVPWLRITRYKPASVDLMHEYFVADLKFVDSEICTRKLKELGYVP